MTWAPYGEPVKLFIVKTILSLNWVCWVYTLSHSIIITKGWFHLHILHACCDDIYGNMREDGLHCMKCWELRCIDSLYVWHRSLLSFRNKVSELSSLWQPEASIIIIIITLLRDKYFTWVNTELWNALQIVAVFVLSIHDTHYHLQCRGYYRIHIEIIWASRLSNVVLTLGSREYHMVNQVTLSKKYLPWRLMKMDDVQVQWTA